MATLCNLFSFVVATVASPGVCRFVLSLDVNLVCLSCQWTTIGSNSCVTLGAAAINTSQSLQMIHSVSGNLPFATTKKGK